MDDALLQLRRAIFEAFAATGAPPDVADSPQLRALAEAESHQDLDHFFEVWLYTPEKPASW